MGLAGDEALAGTEPYCEYGTSVSVCKAAVPVGESTYFAFSVALVISLSKSSSLLEPRS